MIITCESLYKLVYIQFIDFVKALVEILPCQLMKMIRFELLQLYMQLGLERLMYNCLEVCYKPTQVSSYWKQLKKCRTSKFCNLQIVTQGRVWPYARLCVMSSKQEILKFLCVYFEEKHAGPCDIGHMLVCNFPKIHIVCKKRHTRMYFRHTVVQLVKISFYPQFKLNKREAKEIEKNKKLQ